MIASPNGKIFSPANSEDWKTWNEWDNTGYLTGSSGLMVVRDGMIIKTKTTRIS